MNTLMKSETQDKDRYIVRDKIHRNPEQCYHEAQKILLELEDMLNPDLPLYPNPTRDCSRMCSFLTPCVNMDDGSDWEALLTQAYSSRDQDLERLWRARLPSPIVLYEQFNKEAATPDLLDMQMQALAESYKTQGSSSSEADLSDEDKEALQLAAIASGEYPLAEWEQKNPDPFLGMDERGRFNMAEVD
jgi:hypothetical protein